MVWFGSVVVHVVMNTVSEVSWIMMVRSGVAGIGLPIASKTAPAPMSSWGVPIAAMSACWESVRAKVRVLPEMLFVPAPSSDMPPVDWPTSRTCSRSYLAVPLRGWVKDMVSQPVPVE